MNKKPTRLRTCLRGHKFYKTSECPSCPICESGGKPRGGFLAVVSAPARRALEREGIDSLKRLSQYSEIDLLKLHGIGPSSIPKLRQALRQNGLFFKKIQRR